MSANPEPSRSKQLLQQVEAAQGMDKLLTVMQALRDPKGGCPWDKKQSYASILPFTIEEVYEVAEAIETQDFDSLKEELGDLLFQIVFYAQIAKEEGRFDFYDLVNGICDKLVRRHGHVFLEQNYTDEKHLNNVWETHKQIERNQKSNQTTNQPASLIDDIPKALPELKRAHKIQQRVAKVGFDWPDVSFVWDKIIEECEEVKEAVIEGDQTHIEEELGDLMFALVNLTRHYGVDADMALRKANQKFERRFRHVENLADKPLKDSNLEEMEEWWRLAKIIT